MSYGCMYILRRVNDLHILHDKLMSAAKSEEFGLCFTPVNNLLLEGSVELDVCDFAFEVCDSFSSSDASLILSHEGQRINGVQAKVPLLQRLKILQDVALVCAPHAEKIEIYLGEDTPYIPDYSNYTIACADIADALYKEYLMDDCTPYVPCVRLIIERQGYQ